MKENILIFFTKTLNSPPILLDLILFILQIKFSLLPNFIDLLATLHLWSITDRLCSSSRIHSLAFFFKVYMWVCDPSVMKWECQLSKIKTSMFITQHFIHSNISSITLSQSVACIPHLIHGPYILSVMCEKLLPVS